MNRAALAQTCDPTGPAAGAEIVIDATAAYCDPLGALYLPDVRLLVVSDLHLEKGAAFARRGLMLPPYDTLSTLKLLSAMIARYQPRTVVSLGDNFHDRNGAATMPPVYREMIGALAAGREWIWITGNHDPHAHDTLPGSSADMLSYGGLTFVHEPTPTADAGQVAGHLHPSATVRRREKTVRRPCFATDGRRLVMPAFGVLTGGLDLRHQAFEGLFDQTNLIAHMLGRDRVYSVRFHGLIG